MRNVAICGSRVKSMLPLNTTIDTVDIKGVPVSCGLLVTPDPVFDSTVAENRSRVFVRITGFSCNYRDLSLIFAAMKRGENSFFPTGSDFVGEVLEVGAGVTTLKPGDRIIADNSYTMFPNPETQDGVLTNRASREYQIFPESKLVKVPASMPDEVAAAFSIGAQTAYSMVRKLDPAAGANVLVTSARSNTSLFAINALRKHNVNTYAATTSTGFERALMALGVKEVWEVDHGPRNGEGAQPLKDRAASLGGFDYVIDPFFDLHLDKVIDCLAPNGKYITCGLHHQYQSLLGIKSSHESPDTKRILLAVLIKNLHILGNCLGVTEDLRNAIDDFDSNRFNVVIDSAFSDGRVSDFLHKTYSATDRFGKVVYTYRSAVL